jgi:hypothetical protein
MPATLQPLAREFYVAKYSRGGIGSDTGFAASLWPEAAQVSVR